MNTVFGQLSWCGVGYAVLLFGSLLFELVSEVCVDRC
jgi:hypothetical protein